jgi:hypothetical protein
MALQYMRDLGGGQLEPEFVRRLEAAPSNVPDFHDGGQVYRRLIRPAVVDLRRVVAHYAISSLFEPPAEDAHVYAWRVQRCDEATDTYNGTVLKVGHVRAASATTGETKDLMYAVLHFGGHDFSCGIRGYEDQVSYDTMKADLLRRYGQRTLAEVVRGLDDYFPRDLFGLTHLFLEERRRVLARVIQSVLDKHEETYHRVWEESRRLVRYLRQAEAPIPEVFRITAKHVLEEEITTELGRAAEAGVISPRVFEHAEEARVLGIELDLTAARPAMGRAVSRALERLAASATYQAVADATALVRGAQRLGVRFGLWRTQNRFFELWKEQPAARDQLRPLADALGFSLEVKEPT